MKFSRAEQLAQSLRCDQAQAAVLKPTSAQFPDPNQAATVLCKADIRAGIEPGNCKGSPCPLLHLSP